jgi:hypothetical protein
MAAPKVYWSDPQHDDKVQNLIGEGMEACMRIPDLWDCGIGIIDFADCTVVVITRAIPAHEVFVTNRRDENSIHAGYGTNPFQGGETVDFAAALGAEIKNPDAPQTIIPVNGFKR